MSSTFDLDRATVLKSWRHSAERSSARIAHELGISQSRLLNWESGRPIALGQSGEFVTHLRRFGQLVGAPRALPDLWTAVCTAEALPARSLWQHNFRELGRAGWVWLRPRSAGPLEADLWWGHALQGTVRIDSGRNGVLLHVPTSVPNPPLEVTFRNGLGWVDFGSDQVPAQVTDALDIRAGYAHDHLHATAGGVQEPQELTTVLRRVRVLARRIGVPWDIVAPSIAEIFRTDVAPHALDGADLVSSTYPGQARFDGKGRLVAQLLLDGASAQTLREKRGFSRSGAAEALGSLPGANPTQLERHVRQLEVSGRLPDLALFLARLDTLYRADGRLGIDAVHDIELDQTKAGCSTWLVRFPSWWIGPVWLQPRSDGAPTGRMHLRWDPWARTQQVRTGYVLTARKAPGRHGGDKPLRVELPHDWTLQAGTGVVPRAHDINHGWHPSSLTAVGTVLWESWREIDNAHNARRVMGQDSAHAADR